MRCSASRATLAAGLLAAFASVFFTQVAEAAPVQFGSSYYEYVLDEAVTWSDANAAASGATFMGIQGHLATVTSAGENDFLKDLAQDFTFPQGAWLGGAVNAAGDSSWVVGPEAGQMLSFNNFGSGQPNGGPANIYMNIGTLFDGIGHGQWGANAGPVFASIAGYFVEYSVAPVPVPAALPLMLSGLLGLGFVGWRRKKTATLAD